jgi:hypothetical protein
MPRSRKFQAANTAPGDLLQRELDRHLSSSVEVIMIMHCEIHGSVITISALSMRSYISLQESFDLREFCLEVQQNKIVNLTRTEWKDSV